MSKQIKKNVKMIDVGGKKTTKRIAVAEAFINLSTVTKEKIYKNKIIKGDVISVAKTAGILAAKNAASKANILAIAGSLAAEQYGLEIIRSNIG